MKMIEAISWGISFSFFFYFPAPTHTHTIYAVNIWTPFVSGCTIHQTFNDSNRSFKCGNKDVCKATQIIVEISEYLLSNTIDEFYYAFLNARLC